MSAPGRLRERRQLIWVEQSGGIIFWGAMYSYRILVHRWSQLSGLSRELYNVTKTPSSVLSWLLSFLAECSHRLRVIE